MTRSQAPANAEIIVSAKGLSSSDELAEPGHDWIVEGDFGFLASYATQAQAERHAREEVAAMTERGMAVTWSVNA